MVSFILLIPAAKIIFITHNKSQSLVALIVLLIVVPGCIILQNRLVEDMKKGYPERHGDVYDINFNKDMINSFDEREKSNMHEAAFKSFVIFSIAAVFAGCGLCARSDILFSYLIVKPDPRPHRRTDGNRLNKIAFRIGGLFPSDFS